MAEEFQAGICGEAWWINPTRSSSSSNSLSPCNSAAGFGLSDHHMGSFLWSSCDLLDMKTTAAAKTNSREESNNSVSADSSSNMVFQKHTADSDSGGSSSIFMDSTLQITNFAPSPSYSTYWNLGGNGRAENNYPSMILEDLNSQIQKEWSPKSFTSARDQEFSLFGGFPVNSASYGHTSALLQSCFEPDTQPAGLQQSPYNNNRAMTDNICTANYGTNSNYELSPSSWPKFAAPFLKPSMPKQQQSNGLHFSSNTQFWNSSAATDSRPGLMATVLGEKRTCTPTFTSKSHREEVRDSGSAAKKGSSEPAFKRPRIETPSPLPTFKVRKEKLGDRITALQQLVSPFGKTDTASVLHEAIEYIKFLHDQVSFLTTPYMKQGTQIPQQQSCDHKQDLKSRGLCLGPISSTFLVANETTADFWTPTFGATFS